MIGGIGKSVKQLLLHTWFVTVGMNVVLLVLCPWIAITLMLRYYDLIVCRFLCFKDYLAFFSPSTTPFINTNTKNLLLLTHYTPFILVPLVSLGISGSDVSVTLYMLSSDKMTSDSLSMSRWIIHSNNLFQCTESTLLVSCWIIHSTDS